MEQKSEFKKKNFENILDQTWLGVRCHQEWEFKPLLFSHSWTTQGPNQPVDKVTAAALLKYGQKCA